MRERTNENFISCRCSECRVVNFEVLANVSVLARFSENESEASALAPFIETRIRGTFRRPGFRECATKSFLEARDRFPRILDAHGVPLPAAPRANWPAHPRATITDFGQRRAEMRHVRGLTGPDYAGAN